MISSSTATNSIVNVAITSDLMCPWCWVGLKKLQEASKVSKIGTNITWKPFLLRPNTPMEGIPKTGTPESRVGSRLRQAGESVGINFTGLTDRTPNTTLFHATLKHLQDNIKLPSDVVTSFHESVFEGYFTLGAYPDENGLLKAAAKTPYKEVYGHVESLYSDEMNDTLQGLLREVADEAFDASRAGVSGVPSFAFNGHAAFSGAQPVDTFVRHLEHFSKN